MYIDTSNEQFGRITLNAATADKIKNKIIFKSNGNQIGEFDGSTEVELELGDILGGGSGGYLPLSGGTLTGDLTLQKNLIFTENESYGQTLPDIAQEGQVFFMPDDDIYVPAGGTVGQVLTKNSNTDGDITWNTTKAFVRRAKCETAAATSEKIVTFVDDLDQSLEKDTLILITFTNTNSAANVTLNVDGTGGKSIHYFGTYPYNSASNALGRANIPVWYFYDGEKYIWMGHNVDYNNTNYLPLTGGTVTGDITLNHSDGSVNINKAVSSTMYWAGRANAIVKQTTTGGGYYPTISMQTSQGSYEIGPYQGNLRFVYVSDTTYAGQANEVEGGTLTTKIYMTPEGNIYGNKVYGAVWNDYAEYRELREDIEIPYGHIVIENGDDTLSLSTKRLQGGGNVCSDTFGFAIGETEKAKMPIAVSGRALVYTYEDRNSYEPGDAVCTGPEGTVSKMTREEIKEYPDRIIGYVSAIPSYETWGENNVKVDGRIWIKVV